MKLNPGEVICPKCKANNIVEKGNLMVWGCDKCQGVGKLDWIEVVVGKNPIYEPWFPPAGLQEGK